MFINSSRREFLQKVTDLAKGVGISLIFLPIISCEKDWIIPPQLKGEFIEIDLTNEKKRCSELSSFKFSWFGRYKAI